MYINQDIGSTEAYKAAQARSRWVNPNMSLLFSLNDFKKIIEEKKAAKRNQRSATCKSPTRHRATLSADAIEFPQKELQIVSLQGDDDSMARNADRSPMTTSRARGNSTPSFSGGGLGQGSSDSSTIVDCDEGTQSFPRPDTSTISNDACMGGFDFGFGNSSSSNALNDSHACLGLKNPTTVVDSEQATSTFSSRTLFSHMADAFQGFAFRNKNSSSRQVTLSYDNHGIDESGLMSPRLQTMTMNPLQQASPRSDATHHDVPPSPSLFSPRVSEFPRGSFFSMIPEAAPHLRADEDPRSPPTKGEAPIHRSIDDVL
jgi:tyrosine-protein phosphatase